MLFSPSTSCCYFRVLLRSVSYLPARKNYYAILGVRTDATTQEIKNAFVARSNQLHPDRQASASDVRVGWSRQSDTEKFMLMKEAYDCLRKPEKRKQYDEEILLTGGGGFLMEATTSRFKESSIVDLNKKRNESYVGPSKQSTHTNHFRDPEKEYYDEKTKNRFLVVLGSLLGLLILGNIGYVWLLRRRQATPEVISTVHETRR